MYKYFLGGISSDQRGQIRFFNDFNLEEIKRFYLIKNSNLETIRGWRAHKIEQRWFYVLSGSFSLCLVIIDDWIRPSRDLEVEEVVLDSKDHKVIHVPPGYATAFKALEVESEILVFADYPIDHAKLDDYTYDSDYFVNYKYF